MGNSRVRNTEPGDGFTGEASRGRNARGARKGGRISLKNRNIRLSGGIISWPYGSSIKSWHRAVQYPRRRVAGRHSRLSYLPFLSGSGDRGTRGVHISSRSENEDSFPNAVWFAESSAGEKLCWMFVLDP